MKPLPKCTLLWTCFLFTCTIFFLSCSISHKKTKGSYLEKERERTGAREAMQRDVKMMKDPALGYVPAQRLIAAKEYKDRLMMNGRDVALTGVSWKSQGPKNQGGRSRTMLIDANDATGKTVFAASVGGGLWKTTDITAASPNWTSVNDLLGNLAVTSIAQDPASPNTMYLATGEGYGNIDAIQGLGVFKSTDGGTTWAQLAATNNSNFYFCQKLAVGTGGVLYVATAFGGLQRSSNGGTTFTKVLGSGLGITGATNNFCYDVKIATNGDVYSSLSGSIHKSTNAGVTFLAAQTLPVNAGRIEVACAPSDANYVYAICESGDAVAGILRTTDAGTTWVVRTEPNDADPGIPDTDFSRTQAWYDLSLAVDPLNRDVLFTGGVDIFKSADGAGTWTQVAHWYGGFGLQYAHADQHFVYYKPGSSTEAYFCNDGGIFRTTNANAAVPTLTDKGANYVTAQFYSCAMHPTTLTSYYLAGAQDNGTHQFNTSGIQNTAQVTGGDGAFCHIDQNQPQYQFTSYVGNDFNRSADNGATWTNVTTTGGSFISPTDYDDLNNIMYMCDGTSNYRRWDNPQTGSTFVSVAVAAFGGQVTSLKVSPNTANRVFFGIDNGRIFRVDNAQTATPTATNISTGLPAGYPACVEVETGNDNHLLVTYSNYGVNSIWESTNGGTTWTSVEGNLPDMPIRWALFNPGNNDQAIIATELGVWSTDNLNGGATVWGSSNSGLANVRVDMLQVRQSDKLVVAATHGRGLFTSDLFTTATALFSADKLANYTGIPVKFTSSSYKATSWSWTFGDGGTSTAENPSYSYATAGKYSVTLTINAGASSITKTQYIQILPNKSVPYFITDGGGFEVNVNDFGVDHVSGTPWEKGNSAVAGKNGTRSGTSAWVTGLAGNYANNGETNLLSPNFNLATSGTYAVKFWGKSNTETNYDGYRVEYSLDKGISWTPLGTTTGTSWYNFANTAGGAAFPVNQAFINGSIASYTLYTRDISFLSGNANVAFRIRFKSEIDINAAGVAIDDIEITGPGNYWNGSFSNVWTEPRNWDGLLVPGINSNVIIPSVATNMPRLFASAEIKSLKLMPGAVVNVNTGFTLKLNGTQ